MIRVFIILLAAIITGLSGCIPTSESAKTPEPFNVIVDIDDKKTIWTNKFTNTKGKSCYLADEVMLGTTIDISSGKVIEIGYILINNTLVIETYPGLCDVGTQVMLTKNNGVYSGDLYSRSFGGFNKIGTVVQQQNTE